MLDAIAEPRRSQVGDAELTEYLVRQAAQLRHGAAGVRQPDRAGRATCRRWSADVRRNKALAAVLERPPSPTPRATRSTSSALAAAAGADVADGEDRSDADRRRARRRPERRRARVDAHDAGAAAVHALEAEPSCRERTRPTGTSSRRRPALGSDRRDHCRPLQPTASRRVDATTTCEMRSQAPAMTPRTTHVYDRLLRERIIFLGPQVDDDIANQICAQLLLLAAEDPERDITSTSTRPAARSRPAWRSSTRCSSSSTTSRPSRMGLAASMGQFLLSRRHHGQALRPAARADHDAPAAPAASAARRPTSRSRPSSCCSPRSEMAELIAEHTGQTARADRGRLRPRPLVHRRGGPGVRLRRPRRRASVAAGARRRRPGTARLSETAMSELTTREASPARQPTRPAVAATSCRPSSSARTTASRSRTRTTSCSRSASSSSARRSTTSSANDVMAQLIVPGVDGPRPRHPDLHQLARWLVHRADRDLRHDAVRPARHPDVLHGPGRLGRRGAAGRRHQGQAVRAAERPDPDPPALRRGQRGQVSDLEIQANEILRMRALLEEILAKHTGQTDRAGPRRHRARQDPHRRRRPRSTASSTRSSPPASSSR